MDADTLWIAGLIGLATVGILVPQLIRSRWRAKGRKADTEVLRQAEVQKIRDANPPRTTPVSVPRLTVRDEPSQGEAPDLAGITAPQAAASMDASFKVIALQGPRAGTEYLLNKDELTIGRSADNVISIPDISVARKHARFRREANGFSVTDLKSGNGTKINGTRVESASLNDGDELVLGDTVLQYLRVGEARAPKVRVMVKPTSTQGSDSVSALAARDSVETAAKSHLSSSDGPPTTQTRKPLPQAGSGSMDQGKAHYLELLKQEFSGLPAPALVAIAIRSARRVESAITNRNAKELQAVTRARIELEKRFGFETIDDLLKRIQNPDYSFFSSSVGGQLGHNLQGLSLGLAQISMSQMSPEKWELASGVAECVAYSLLILDKQDVETGAKAHKVFLRDCRELRSMGVEPGSAVTAESISKLIGELWDDSGGSKHETVPQKEVHDTDPSLSAEPQVEAAAEKAAAEGTAPGVDANGATFRLAGLEWQMEPAPVAMTWAKAKDYAAGLTLAGGGWRLPTGPELRELFNARDRSSDLARLPGMESPPGYAQVATQEEAARYAERAPGWAATVGIFSALGGYSAMTSSEHPLWADTCLVRCVRAGQADSSLPDIASPNMRSPELLLQPVESWGLEGHHWNADFEKCSKCGATRTSALATDIRHIVVFTIEKRTLMDALALKMGVLSPFKTAEQDRRDEEGLRKGLEPVAARWGVSIDQLWATAKTMCDDPKVVDEGKNNFYAKLKK